MAPNELKSWKNDGKSRRLARGLTRAARAGLLYKASASAAVAVFERLSPRAATAAAWRAFNGAPLRADLIYNLPPGQSAAGLIHSAGLSHSFIHSSSALAPYAAGCWIMLFIEP